MSCDVRMVNFLLENQPYPIKKSRLNVLRLSIMLICLWFLKTYLTLDSTTKKPAIVQGQMNGGNVCLSLLLDWSFNIIAKHRCDMISDMEVVDTAMQ